MKATKEVQELLRILEEHGLGEKKYFGGNKIGLVDIAFGWIACFLEFLEQAAGVKVLEDNSFPRLQAWIKNFNEIPVVKRAFLIAMHCQHISREQENTCSPQQHHKHQTLLASAWFVIQ